MLLAAGMLGSLGGCASKAKESPPIVGGSGSGTNGSSGAAPTITVIHESDNGTTVHVNTIGGEVILANFSSLWGVPKAKDTAVVAGPPIGGPHAGCATPAKAMGNGCTIPQIVYKAVGKGTTTIEAHRDSCGEALRCVPPNASDFVITVAVDG